MSCQWFWAPTRSYLNVPGKYSPSPSAICFIILLPFLGSSIRKQLKRAKVKPSCFNVFIMMRPCHHFKSCLKHGDINCLISCCWSVAIVVEVAVVMGWWVVVKVRGWSFWLGVSGAVGLVVCVSYWMLVHVWGTGIGVEVSGVDALFSEIGLFVSLDFLVFLVFGGFSVSCCDIVTFRGNIFSLFAIVLLVYPSLLVWECFQWLQLDSYPEPLSS